MCLEVSLDDGDTIVGDVGRQGEGGGLLSVISEDIHHRGSLCPTSSLGLADNLRVEDALGVDVQFGVALPFCAHFWCLERYFSDDETCKRNFCNNLPWHNL